MIKGTGKKKKKDEVVWIRKHYSSKSGFLDHDFTFLIVKLKNLDKTILMPHLQIHHYL
jgi:hypothetical protein